MSRLDAIRKIVEQSPNDAFARYGLAMELKNAGLAEEAHAAFEELERRSPDYVAQYLMHGNLLAGLKRTAEAKAVLERGIEVARRTNNGHALGEMEQALETLED
ncbi:MAG: hypothetical protein ACHQ17_03290 [Polyangia bacterium]|jgi:tetratricopeptide (TPR) repeat protein